MAEGLWRITDEDARHSLFGLRYLPYVIGYSAIRHPLSAIRCPLFTILRHLGIDGHEHGGLSSVLGGRQLNRRFHTGTVDL